MLKVCLHSYQLHLTWWLLAFSKTERKTSPIGLARLCFLCLLFPLFLWLQTVHWFGFFIDSVCFRSYRNIEVKAPVFITGIPRSGTTFLHRTLAVDQAQFTSISTWEAILAPSIFERKCIHTLQWFDRKIGGLFGRLLQAALKTLTGGLDDIHKVDLEAPEEDYLCLLPAASCFILLLAFPHSTWLRQIGSLPKMNSEQRQRLLDFYQRCLQKHLYLQAPEKRLLSKNAAFGSWAPELLKRFPDASVVLCIRDPLSGLSSQLSSLAPARQIFGTDPSGEQTRKIFTLLFQENYELLADFCQQAPTESVGVIDQADLEKAPADVINQTLERFNIPRAALQATLDSLKPRVGSAHRHSASEEGLDSEEIKVCLQPPYETMLQSSLRIRPTNSL